MIPLAFKSKLSHHKKSPQTPNYENNNTNSFNHIFY